MPGVSEPEKDVKKGRKSVPMVTWEAGTTCTILEIGHFAAPMLQRNATEFILAKVI